MTGIRKSKKIALLRDGDTFKIIHGYRKCGDGLAGDYIYTTTNAREAAVNYTGAIADDLIREIMQAFTAEGYDFYTGIKRKE